ncbi:uridine kinase [Chitinophagales bacterium]|nr:uridine kinase [Chitinophagales bacterium]
MNDVLTIGIAGGTGSGKTTIVRTICDHFEEGDLVVIPQDNYYRDNSHMELSERQKLNFDHPDSIEFELLVDHLKTLKKGEPVELPSYSYLSCTRSEETTRIESKPIVLVEGILVLTQPKVREQLDIMVYVDAESDDRLMRCIKRDIEERGRTMESVRERYYKTVKPMHLEFIEPSKRLADIIIPNDRRNHVAMDLLVARIQVHLLKQKIEK